MGLMGDATDNIPGVKGIGEKTAKKLIAEFGTIENLLTRLSEVKSDKLRGLLEAQADAARQSRQLATIVTDCPVTFERERFRLGEVRTDELIALYRELEFWGLLNMLHKPIGGELRHEERMAVLDDPADRSRLVQAIRDAAEVAIHCDLVGDDPFGAAVRGIGVCAGPGQASYFPGEAGLADLRPVLEDPAVHVYVHDAKAAWLALRRSGIRLTPRFDTLLAAYLLTPNRRSPALETLAQEYLAESLDYAPSDKKSKKGDLFEQPDPGETATRADRAAAAIARLQPILAEKLTAAGMYELFERVELPLTVVLGEMEATGFRVDTGVLARLSKELESQLDRLLDEIYRKAGMEFNVNSPKQLSEVLFEKLKLPPVKKTKTGYSTDEEVLTQLALQHDLPAQILNYRSLSKLKSTYVDALPTLVNPETGRLHTSLNQTVAATGRLSSADPNLQNIPVKGEYGLRIREAFVAAPGHTLLCADYSQIEPRILAYLSRDERLVKVFERGEDIHTATAVEIFKLSPDLVTKEMRRAAKTVVFGIVYGISPFGLSQNIGVSQTEAKKYIDAYFERYAGVKAFLDKTIEGAKEKGFTTTILGRRRPIPELQSPDPTQRSFGERMAVNSPIQGSAADLIKVAMIAVSKRLHAELPSTKMILQVHDELIFETPEKDVEKAKQLVKSEMEATGPRLGLSVPLKVDLGVGRNWRAAHP